MHDICAIRKNPQPVAVVGRVKPAIATRVSCDGGFHPPYEALAFVEVIG